MTDKGTENLIRLGSFCKDFLEAADFPHPYYPDSLGMKVGKALPCPLSDEIESLRVKRVTARISGNIDDLCTANIQLAEAFIKAADKVKGAAQGRAIELIPRSVCTPSLADALDQANAPTLGAIVRNKSARPLL